MNRMLTFLYVTLIGIGASWASITIANSPVPSVEPSCEEVAAYSANPVDLTDEQLHYASYAYDHGECVEKDDARAFAYYLESAERGYELSMLRLGQLYAKGAGVERDIQRARYWFRSYALTNPSDRAEDWDVSGSKLLGSDHLPPLFFEEMGRMESSHASAAMMIQNYHDLIKGNGAVQDIKAARRWLSFAVLTGSSEALYLNARHAITYENNYRRYRTDLVLAAIGNHPQAQVEHGRLYLGSDGVDPWPYNALVWFVRAQMNGLEVDTDIAEAEKHLSPDERRAAYAKAADFDFTPRP